MQGKHADAALALAQSEHARELQQQSERISQEAQEQLGQLYTQLAEEKWRGQQLEAQLNQQARQASVQMSLQQVGPQCGHWLTVCQGPVMGSDLSIGRL